MQMCWKNGMRSCGSQHFTALLRSGSSARPSRGEETPASDIDLLVECEPGRNLLDHVALVQDLEDLLGRTVDVVTEGGLHWCIRDRIHREAVPL